MKHITHSEIKNILDSIDTEAHYVFAPRRPPASEVEKLRELLMNSMNPANDSTVSVLGLDIFKYSQFEPLSQKLVPFVFRILLERTIKGFAHAEPLMSSFYDDGDLIGNRFIDSGDGGFLVLRTPLDSLIFAMLFVFNLQEFNSFHLYPKLREILGPLTVRYAITFDKMFKYGNNYFGPAIIRNARILSKDKLNRCLLDAAGYEWFLLNTNGLESLRSITLRELRFLEAYKSANLTIKKSLFFQSLKQNEEGLQNLIVQRLEQISAKEQAFEVYNVMMQVTFHRLANDEKAVIGNFTATLGNLNTAGL